MQSMRDTYTSIAQWEQAGPLRQWRDRRRLTQSRAARHVGVSLSSYRLWEQGVTIPNPRNMAKLSRLLDTPELAGAWEAWWQAKPEEG